MQHPLKWVISQKQCSRVGVVHSNQSKMPGDRSATCICSLLYCLLKYRLRRGSGAQVPFSMSAVFSWPLSILVNTWLCHTVPVGWLRQCCPGAGCWPCSENFADGLPGTWLMHAQVPLGRNGNFKSATPSAHISFINQWVKKKKNRDARYTFCMLLYLGCAFCLLVMSGAGAQSGVNDSSEKAWGSHLVSGSCRGNLLVQDPQLFLKLASADICSENACQNFFHQFGSEIISVKI